MEDDRIGLVLARATELRLKIGNCVHKASVKLEREDDEEAVDGEKSAAGADDDEEVEDDDEQERLLHICDALEALETQLASLQALQQQQRYEREAALSDIESSRRMLLDKLKEYKGKDLEVIHEASAFAGETVEHSNDLLLPPYPSRPPPHTFVLDNGYTSHFPSVHKPVRNGVISNLVDEAKKDFEESEESLGATSGKDFGKGLGHFIGVTAKVVLTVGVLSILGVTSFGPRLGKKESAFSFLGLFQPKDAKEKRSTVRSTTGKDLVMEHEEARRVVKERIEVPFKSIVSTPDVNYGCG